jgi:hypothetical protein
METVITAEKIYRQRKVMSNYTEYDLIVIGDKINQGITCLITVSEARKDITLYSLFDDSSLGVLFTRTI